MDKNPSIVYNVLITTLLMMKLHFYLFRTGMHTNDFPIYLQISQPRFKAFLATT